MTNPRLALVLLACALAPFTHAADGVRDRVANKLAADYPALEKLYTDLHLHPELSHFKITNRTHSKFRRA